MSRPDRHKAEKKLRRRTLERVFRQLIDASFTLFDWLNMHENPKEEDARDVLEIVVDITEVAFSVADLYKWAYGQYTDEMLTVLEAKKLPPDENEEGQNE